LHCSLSRVSTARTCTEAGIMQAQNWPFQQGAMAGWSPTASHGTERGWKFEEHLYKTKLCHWQLLGHCARGKSCRFAHSTEELQNRPDLRKTQLCDFFARGNCKSGDRCKFAHGLGDLQTTCLAKEVSSDESSVGTVVWSGQPCARARSEMSTCATTFAGDHVGGVSPRYIRMPKTTPLPDKLVAVTESCRSGQAVAMEAISELALGTEAQTWCKLPHPRCEVVPPKPGVGIEVPAMITPVGVQDRQVAPVLHRERDLLVTEQKAAKRHEELVLLTKVLGDIVYGNRAFHVMSF